MKLAAHPRLRALNERLFPDRLVFGPTHVILGVNNFCNLRCVMCDVGTGNSETNFGANLVGAQTRSMPIELFRHIADILAQSTYHQNFLDQDLGPSVGRVINDVSVSVAEGKITPEAAAAAIQEAADQQ